MGVPRLPSPKKPSSGGGITVYGRLGDSEDKRGKR